MPRSRKPTTQAPDTAGPVYPIRAVSAMTGVAIDTLRAWERRYGAVTPRRDERGRLYTDADIRRIRLLRDVVQGGHGIGRVARLPEERLAELAQNAAVSVTQASDPAHMVDRRALIAALERFDSTTVEQSLARAAALLRPPELMKDLVLPVLAEVGERWHGARAGIAHEHLLSASVRNVLGALMRVHMKSDVPDRLLFATPAGERHEFGTLGAAMLAASGGLGAIYLGPDIPADDIIAVTQVVSVDVVVLGITGANGAGKIDGEIEEIARRLPPRIELWLGGPHAPDAAAKLHGRALVLRDFDALEQQLLRIGATF